MKEEKTIINKTYTIKKSYLGKGLASLALAGICSYWAYLSNGTSGIGWFIFGLIIIWTL